MSKYDNIPISDKTSKGMSLTSSDRQWLKRAFDIQDLGTEQLIKDALDIRDKLLCETIREIINEVKLDLKSIHLEVKQIRIDIKDITSDIENLRNRIENHEERIINIEEKIKT